MSCFRTFCIFSETYFFCLLFKLQTTNQWKHSTNMSSNQRSFLRANNGGNISTPPSSSISPSLQRTTEDDNNLLFTTYSGGGSGGIQRKVSGQGQRDRLFVTGGAGDLRVILEQAKKLQIKLRKCKQFSNKTLIRLLGLSKEKAGNVDEGKNAATDDPLLVVIQQFIKTATIQFKQRFFDDIVSTLQTLRHSDKRATKCLFCISPVLQMWASIEHNDSLDSMQRIQASMSSESSDSDLAEDESVLRHFRSIKKKRSTNNRQRRGSAFHFPPSNNVRSPLNGRKSEPPTLMRGRSAPHQMISTSRQQDQGQTSKSSAKSSTTSTTSTTSKTTSRPPPIMNISLIQFQRQDEQNNEQTSVSQNNEQTSVSQNNSTHDFSSSMEPFPRSISPPLPMNPSSPPYLSSSSLFTNQKEGKSSSVSSTTTTTTPTTTTPPPGRYPMGSPSSMLSASPLQQHTIQDFEILEPLSRGAYGRVFLAREHISSELVAIKVMRKSELVRKNRVDFILEEQKIMASVAQRSLPFVVGLRCSFQSRRYLFLCMEYCPGGDLLSLMSNIGYLSEEVAKQYLAEMTLALGSLHECGIVHRDIKPDNVCIDANGHVKLTDFGLSFAGAIVVQEDEDVTTETEGIDEGKVDHERCGNDEGGSSGGGKTADRRSAIDDDVGGKNADRNEEENGRRNVENAEMNNDEFGLRKGHVGTPDYMAPEILLGREHTEAVDWWSLGVVAYELLTGSPPFNAKSAEDVFSNILQRRLVWPEEKRNKSDDDDPIIVSREAKAFIEAMLVLDPKERLGTRGGVAEVKQHVFFQDIPWNRLTLDHTYVPFVPSIDNENDTSYFSPDRRERTGTTVEEPPTPVGRQVSHGKRFQNFGFHIDDIIDESGELDTDSNASGTPRK